MAFLRGNRDPSVGCGEIAHVPREHKSGQQRKNKCPEENASQLCHLGQADMRTRHADSALFQKYRSEALRLIVSELIPVRSCECSDCSSTQKETFNHLQGKNLWKTNRAVIADGGIATYVAVLNCCSKSHLSRQGSSDGVGHLGSRSLRARFLGSALRYCCWRSAVLSLSNRQLAREPDRPMLAGRFRQLSQFRRQQRMPSGRRDELVQLRRRQRKTHPTSRLW